MLDKTGLSVEQALTIVESELSRLKGDIKETD